MPSMLMLGNRKVLHVQGLVTSKQLDTLNAVSSFNYILGSAKIKSVGFTTTPELIIIIMF